MRDRAWRRAQRQRWITRRTFIIKNIWLETFEKWIWIKGGSRLAKYNLTCGGPMCKLNAYYTQQEKRHREDMKHPIET